jgi:hypothetical protein
VCRTLNAPTHLYYELICRRCTSTSRQWWNDILEEITSPFRREEFDKAYTKAARKLGGAPLELDPDEVLALSSSGLPLFQGRALHELGRTVLLLCATEYLALNEQAEWIEALYARGDNAEREALLHALPLLPEPNRFLPTAVEACRSNVQTIFEAIACENPYPALHFPELNFNQMVMKAIFIGVPLRRIVGLPARIAPVLVRMAKDYVRERAAAGRPVPDDIQFITSGG